VATVSADDVVAAVCSRQGESGHDEVSGNVEDCTSLVPAANTRQWGSVPRGPWLTGVPAPKNVAPNTHRPDRMIIHPNSDTASTR
jgi:hypothetical protein